MPSDHVSPAAADQVFLTALATLRQSAEVVASSDGTGTGAGALILANWDRRAPTAPAGHIIAADPALAGLPVYRQRWREVVG